MATQANALSVGAAVRAAAILMAMAPGAACRSPANPTPPTDAPAPRRLPRPQDASMVRCSGGTFQIGNDADSTWPVHTVTVAPFEIDVTEVTVDAYAACVKRGECSPAETSDAKRCNWGVSGKGDHPVNCVDWEQATTYCHTLGKRLPSEEEWEFAARGGRERRSDSPAHERRGVQACGVGTSEHPGTCAVGSFPRGPFGLADMTGNVMEWTDSKFHDDETTRVIQHESEGPLHHWESDRSHRHDNVGFRCAR